MWLLNTHIFIPSTGVICKEYPNSDNNIYIYIVRWYQIIMILSHSITKYDKEYFKKYITE